MRTAPASAPAMEFHRVDCGVLPICVRASRFTGRSGVTEVHLMAEPTTYAHVHRQLAWLEQGLAIAAQAFGLGADTSVLRRVYCSDIVNQHAHLRGSPLLAGDAATSIVGQPPAPPAKVAIWDFHIVDPNQPLRKALAGPTLRIDRGELTHHWTTGLSSEEQASSSEQTRAIFDEQFALLEAGGMTLADHVVRTWLFVADIDTNYRGMVEARREIFTAHGLTPQTHYLASSGIEARHASIRAKVAMDSYAIAGLQPEQVTQIKALAHLSPTHVYGVTFERATAIDYRDRRHVLLSGTASIDARGEIVHVGNALRQLDRTMENIAALLDEADADLGSLTALTVYLRDLADHEPVRARLREMLGDVPMVIVLAPVCRPGWLVEIEGIATIARDAQALPAF